MTKHIELARIGMECRLIRIKHGLTLQQVADELGTTRQNIFNFEAGKNNNALFYEYYKNTLDK